MSTRSTAPSSVSWVRRGLIGVAIGALLASACTVLALGTSGATSVSEHTSTSRTEAARTFSAAEEVFNRSAPGDCLSWSTPSADDLALVDCAEPHLFEVASLVELNDQSGVATAPGSALPDAAELTVLRDTLCTPAVTTYLNGRFDAHGMFTVGLIDPGEASWQAGSRTVRCGVQHVGRAGEEFPIQGRVAALDQSDIAPAWSCENIAAGLPADPVDCTLPHASEVISVVDLGQRFLTGYPAVADQDVYLDETCRAAAAAALGTPDAGIKGLTVFWDNLPAQSWSVGSRRVNCSVGKQLPAGGFAPMTGLARDAPALAGR